MKSITMHDLGVFSTEDKVYLYFNLWSHPEDPFNLGLSRDGLTFKSNGKIPEIILSDGKKENTAYCRDFRITKVDGKYLLTYKYTTSDSFAIKFAESKDLIKWTGKGELPSLTELGMIVPDTKVDGKYLLITGENELRLAFSENLTDWEVDESPLISPRGDFFDDAPITLGNILITKRGILVLYFSGHEKANHPYILGAVLLERNDPRKIIWRSNKPLQQFPENPAGETVYPLGIIEHHQNFISYFEVDGRQVVAVLDPTLRAKLGLEVSHPTYDLMKAPHNPIIKPVLTHYWESQATFNTAAVVDEGKVHFLYRAIGDTGISSLGYAASSDGLNIDERGEDGPAYWPRAPFEYPGMPDPDGHPSLLYMSGGGYGGVEDPRLTKIEDTYYLTYIAYNGWDHPRLALSSISEDDFRNKRWNNWKQPVLISRPGVVDKNVAIFPEKIRGKYVIFHRVFPNILVDYVDHLDFDGTEFLKGEYMIKPRGNGWDSRKIGAGPPPLKTKDGWLLIYHAVDDKDAGRYKIGAMLLDLNDPTKVLARTNHPIIQPVEWYENEGYKSGVAYPCGAAIMNDKLYIYYGGADTVVCVASADLEKFLHDLKTANTPRLYAVDKARPEEYYHAKP